MSGPSDVASIREALAAVLRGAADVWPSLDRWPTPVVLWVADADGVVPLVAAAAGGSWPANSLQEQARAIARRALAADVVREHELRRVVAAFDADRIPALLTKGADLAYSVYARPDLRPRTDSDVLVAPEDRSRASDALRRLGYAAAPQSGGDLLMYQEPFQLRRDGVVVHVVDLHWRLFNPHRFGTTLPFDDLLRDSEPRTALGPAARGLGTTHALALAAVHRVAHHFGHDRLIWLYDVRVLAERMTPDDWAAFVALAESRSIQGACAATLSVARDRLEARVPGDVVSRLRAASTQDSADAAFLDPQAAHVRRIVSDFRHVDGWTRRLRLARQHLFPPASYMRTVYAPASDAPLWRLYLRRILRGSRRWLAGA